VTTGVIDRLEPVHVHDDQGDIRRVIRST